MNVLPVVLRLLVLLAAAACVGCQPAVRVIADPDTTPIDRAGIEYPAGLELAVTAEGFTAATALTTDAAGNVYVADQGLRGNESRITRLDPDSGEKVEVYPARRAIVSWFDRRPRLYGPVGALAWRNDLLYVAGRDEQGRGVIVAFDLADWPPGEGEPTRRPEVRTIVSGLPAMGDHGVEALAFHPLTGRLYFGLGSATNSGVVGLDNWRSGWLKEHRDFHDRPLTPLKIFGYRFDTDNPAGSLLRPDSVNTAPFNAFGESGQRVPAAADGRPTGAIYSVDPRGGDVRVEAHGLRNPTGLAFDEFAGLYATNQGMELRGTRPVRDDPDVVVRVLAGGGDDAPWYGWPDYSADFRPVTDLRLQPPADLLRATGYGELSPLIDLDGSGDITSSTLEPPDAASLLVARFPPLSGAGGMTVVPDGLPGFEAFAGRLLVPLRGDRAPFATSGLPLRVTPGRYVAVVDVDRGTVEQFVFNAGDTASAAEDARLLHRPADAAFAADGTLFILDAGVLRMRDGQERFRAGTGRVYRLRPAATPETRPATRGS
jgi:glucose/arabinose dehydrogenase